MRECRSVPSEMTDRIVAAAAAGCSLPFHRMDRLASFNFWDLYQWPMGTSFLVTLVLYEHLITFDKEVHYFWNQRQFNLSVFLFFANRYFVWIVVALQLALVFGNLSVVHCAPVFGAITWGIFVGTIISCTILTLRTIALWNGALKIRAVFWVLIPFATIIPSLIAAIRTRSSLKFVRFDKSPEGCKLGQSENNIFFTYIMVTVYELGIFLLTLIRSLPHLRQKHSHWVTVIYAQAFSTANMLLWSFAPLQYHGWLSVIQYAVSSICCSRVVFSLYEQRDVERSSSLKATHETESNNIWTTVIDRQAGEESFWDEFDNDHR
ncbi:hypothetical protein DL96DRAFT_650783 [Flagelloscypha sp. PMI_526]|nr:hypothetical protein DL96DRAFT_650783 [Flagelloscypha sp. PMI_526]